MNPPKWRMVLHQSFVVQAHPLSAMLLNVINPRNVTNMPGKIEKPNTDKNVISMSKYFDVTYPINTIGPNAIRYGATLFIMFFLLIVDYLNAYTLEGVFTPHPPTSLTLL
jgi:hypothetical protein